MKIRSKDKKILGTILGLAYGSGATLYFLSRFIRVQTEVGEQHHASEHWVRGIHSFLTYAVILGLGYLVKSHVVPGIKARARRGRKSGQFLLGVFAVMVLAALGILYFADLDWQNRAAQIHAYLGLSIPAWIAAHIWIAKRDPVY